MNDVGMRTTIDLDEDVLSVTKQMARERKTTLGEVVSDLVRLSLEPRRSAKIRNGARLFEPRPKAPKPTLDLINRLRDDE